MHGSFVFGGSRRKDPAAFFNYVELRKPAAGGLFLVPVFLVNLILKQVYAFSDVLHLAQI